MKISEQKLRESFRCGELKSGLPIFIYETTRSTNDEARAFIENNDAERALFIAEEQTGGRGRLGRKFISERGGLYMSLLLKLDTDLSDAVAITAYTAITVRRAIEELTGISAQIKWVNDIVLGGKKLSGILTEGILSADTGRLKYAVVGIGINALGKAVNSEIAEIATTLEMLGSPISPISLAARVTELFFCNLSMLGTPECAEEYRRHSSLIGKAVTVIKKSESYPATVLGISDKCELILRLDDGREELLATGEVSVRVK